MVHNFFWVAEHAWKTPEMEFSDRVDMVLKNPIKKYSFFEKLQVLGKSAFYFAEILDGTSSPREAIHLVADLDSKKHLVADPAPEALGCRSGLQKHLVADLSFKSTWLQI